MTATWETVTTVNTEYGTKLRPVEWTFFREPPAPDSSSSEQTEPLKEWVCVCVVSHELHIRDSSAVVRAHSSRDKGNVLGDKWLEEEADKSVDS